MATCLLVIDLIPDFLKSLDAARCTALIERTNELVHVVRAADQPIIWVRQEFAADLSDAYLEMREKDFRIAIAGTPGALFDPRLDRLPGEPTIVKKRYSAFFGTDLDVILGRRFVDEVIVAGVNTHACVRTSAIDAYQRDLRVILAVECMESYDARHAETSLRYMDGKIGRALTNQQIEAHFGGR